jgi:hypothetical protein
MHDYQRPPTLYLYGRRDELELALREGQFRLEPHAGCLCVGFSQAADPLAGADSCLVIHHTEQFGERLHRAVQRVLPSWAGIDGAVEYGSRSPLGAAFTKSAAEADEREWLFAWRPMQSGLSLNPVTVRLGSLEQYAELRAGDARAN